MIPFLDINQYFNPGQLLEQYLNYLPSQNPDAPMFPKPKQVNKNFNLLDCEAKILYEENKKEGVYLIL